MNLAKINMNEIIMEKPTMTKFIRVKLYIYSYAYNNYG